MLALVDCNSFYASCEQALNPFFRGKPLVVLSNNDGIVIARSQEAKDLGVEDLIVYHKTKDLILRHNIIVVSSNYTLYHDMSIRVKEILLEFVPEELDENYSIDESFLDLHGMNRFNLTEFGKEIQKTIYRSIKVPVSVGIAPTKVLCKAANHIAKKYKVGTLTINTPSAIDEILSLTPIEKVWGVGRQYSTKLRLIGIHTALDLKNLNPSVARKMMTVNGERIVMELNSIPCIEIENEPPPKKQILSTRSFGRTVSTYSDLEQAVAMHCHMAANKLRKHKLAAKNIGVFIHSNFFDTQSERFFQHASVNMPLHSSNTNDLIVFAFMALKSIFKSGIKYKKSGIILNDIQLADRIQFNLMGSNQIREENERLMKNMDELNQKFGKYMVRFAAYSKPGADWDMRVNMKSPDYTTEWKDIPKAFVY